MLEGRTLNRIIVIKLLSNFVMVIGELLLWQYFVCDNCQLPIAQLASTLLITKD